ncbi:MAG TPA: SRPBCC domain-containing protein [Rhizomicrobium sp.]|nr:SRPBCC domain-containing protein [Rhizomicrobium sp.]
MDVSTASDTSTAENRTTVEPKSDRELVITRTFHAPACLVFEAWATPELLKRWWVPKSCGITFISCDIDARTGGRYRFVFGHASLEQPMEFFGRYIEVIPNARLVWTNEEGGEGGAITTVTFEERGGEERGIETVVVMHDLYSSKEALDRTIASGATCGFGEGFQQLDELLVTLGPSAG